MKSNFVKSALKTSGLMLGLLVLAAWGSTLSDQGRLSFVKEVVAHAREERVTQIREGDYYETLMRPAKGRPTTGTIPIDWITLNSQVLNAAQSEDIYEYKNFVTYAAKPNLDLPNSVEGPVKTNSYGLFDYEHPLEKPAGVRRIAVIGDSVIRGYGVSLDERFSTKLQELLNTNSKEHFEIINFAEPGYVLGQIFDVTSEQVPQFHPDVYVWAFTDMTAGPMWAKDIIQLVQEGQDLKYDILKKTIQQAGIKQTDSAELIRWKLAPYKQTLMRSLILEAKADAEKHSASFMIFLVPSAQDRDAIDAGYAPIRKCLVGTGIPIIDVSHTLTDNDLDKLRLTWHDMHPTAKGHLMIAQNLYNELRENNEAWKDITGSQR